MRFDLNTAPGQGDADQQQAQVPKKENYEKKQEIQDIKSSLETQLERVLFHLLPKGVRHGNKFLIGSIAGEPGQSLDIPLSGNLKGMWKDFASGEGGDIIKLWQVTRGLSFRDTMEEIRAYLGHTKPGGVSRAKLPVATEVQTLPIQTGQVRTFQAPEGVLPPPTKTWHYRNADGVIIGSQTRYDMPDGSKQFRPYCNKQARSTFPTPRPLYNVPEIIQASLVFIVEGEKCADALTGAGHTATTLMGGANTPTDKVDLSPLQGKDVVIWPDNDEPGRKYADNIATALQGIASSISVVTTPDIMPEKWDAADALDVPGFDVQLFITNNVLAWQAPVPEPPPKPRICLADWRVEDRYAGKAPERQWLMSGAMPLGVVGILAASGGVGKSMVMLDLALKVTTQGWGNKLTGDKPECIGYSVEQFGAAVIITAEDDIGEVHRRLEAMDPDNRRMTAEGRLIIVPLPNSGGPSPFVVPGGPDRGPQKTEIYDQLKAQLLEIPNLRFIGFDPMASFVMADINADPAVGAFTMGLFAQLATETGATVLLSHHITKGGSSRDADIMNAKVLRNRIRGSTAIVDGVRFALGLWEPSEKDARSICDAMAMNYRPNLIFQGQLVKANFKNIDETQTYVRDESGVLRCITAALKLTGLKDDDLIDMLVLAVAENAAKHEPFSKRGASDGILERREKLPTLFHEMGRDRMRGLVDSAMLSGRIVRCRINGAGNTPKWLDVPSGPVATGLVTVADIFPHLDSQHQNPFDSDDDELYGDRDSNGGPP
jgi:hypothetical protein